MASVKDEAIVLRRLDYSESSQILLFLTREHGPQRLIAKGIKRGTKTRFAVGIDLLERGWCVFLPSGRGEQSLGTLTEWRQIDLHLGLRGQLQRLYAAQYAAEVTAVMTEDADPHPELFDGLVALLGALCGHDSPLVPLAVYQIVLLQATGFWPDLTRCMMCGKIAPPGRAAYFSAREGGLICRDCEPRVVEKRKVGSATLAALRDGSVTDAIAADVFDLLDYHIAHAIGRPVTLAAFLRR